MAVKNIITSGIGLTPGSIEFIITRGLIAGPALIAPDVPERRKVTPAADNRVIIPAADLRTVTVS